MENQSANLPQLPDGWEDSSQWPWRKRAELAESLAKHIKEGSPTDLMIHIFTHLSEDAKWEVRRTVADCLLGVDDRLLIPLLAKLLNDSNRDVIRSASRIQREMRQGKTKIVDEDADTESIEYLYAGLERKLGKKAAKAAREVAARQIELMIVPVVHDIKNAMQPILSSANNLLMPPVHSEYDAGKEIKRIKDNAKRAHDMLKALMDYAKPMDLRLKEEVLADLISHAVDNARVVFGSKIPTPEFVTNLDASLKVQVDKDGFSRVFENLLKNAAECFSHPRCMQEHPLVVVTVKEDSSGDLAYIKVEDNGAGIHEDELQLIRKFRPGTRSGKPGSTGFGLANVARIVREHSGFISIDSVLGKGTCISILLPISDK